MAHAKSFQPPEGEDALSCPLQDCVDVCGVDHNRSPVMWTPRNLKLPTRSTTALSMLMGASALRCV